jgi:ribose transport system permease protein
VHRTAGRHNSRPAPANRIFRGDISEIAIIVVFVAIVLYLSLTTLSFLSTANIMAILVASSLIAIVACGQTFVIITVGVTSAAKAD